MSRNNRTRAGAGVVMGLLLAASVGCSYMPWAHKADQNADLKAVLDENRTVEIKHDKDLPVQFEPVVIESVDGKYRASAKWKRTGSPEEIAAAIRAL